MAAVISISRLYTEFSRRHLAGMSTVTERWQTVREAAEQRHEEQAERGQTLATQAARWFDRVKKFRTAADECMVLQTPLEADQRFHRAFLSQIIASGEELAILGRLEVVAPNPAGITLEAIEAELELLHATMAGQHFLTPEKRCSVLSEVFGHVTHSEV